MRLKAHLLTLAIPGLLLLFGTLASSGAVYADTLPHGQAVRTRVSTERVVDRIQNALGQISEALQATTLEVAKDHVSKAVQRINEAEIAGRQAIRNAEAIVDNKKATPAEKADARLIIASEKLTLVALNTALDHAKEALKAKTLAMLKVHVGLMQTWTKTALKNAKDADSVARKLVSVTTK